MRKKKSLKKKSNTLVVILFVGFVIFIVAISFISKFVLIVRQSQFDDRRRFTMTVSNTKNIEVISFSPFARSISILKLNENLDSKSLSKFLAIPIDASVWGNSLDINQKVDGLLLKMILDYSRLQTNLTIIDLLRLFVFAKQLPESGVYERLISQDLSTTKIDNIVGRLLNDELIEKDRKTIEIVNGTNVSGLGNRLARLISNMGGDVIIVATANKIIKNSIISYNDDKNYTIERLSKVLGFKTVKVFDERVGDITIVIGEDSL